MAHFQVIYLPTNKKQKLGNKIQGLASHAKYHISPFIAKGASENRELNRYYTVTLIEPIEPIEEWQDMKKYPGIHLIEYDRDGCKVKEIRYNRNDFVTVRRQDTLELGAGRDQDFWVARILQVRAANKRNVYALVAWLYWPEELPQLKTKTSDTVNSSGRRKYHGSRELIASNHLEVISLATIAGGVEVIQWEEEDQNLDSKWYWRQTFCCVTKKLSTLREHCTCNGYFNPDVPMMVCDNEECKLWMHEECLVDSILTKMGVASRRTDSNGMANSAKKGSLGSKIRDEVFDVKFHTEDTVGGNHITATIVISSSNSKTPEAWTEKVTCLKCGAHCKIKSGNQK